MAPEVAAEGRPVRITGVITYFDAERHYSFIEDETGGTYFSPTLLTEAELPEDAAIEGGRYEISGYSQQGSFAPYLSGPAREPPRYLGRAPRPEPVKLVPGRILDPSLEARWITVEAIVRARSYNDERLNLDLTDGKSLFAATVLGKWSEPYLDSLIGARVRLRGVYGGLMGGDDNRLIGLRVLSPAPWHLSILENGYQRAFQQEPVEVEALLRPQAHATGMRLVEGTITAQGPGGEYFMRAGEDDTPLTISRLKTEAEAPTFRHGDRVQAAGFPDFADGVPALNSAKIRRLEQVSGKAQPKPLPEALTDLRHGEFIQTEAQLIDRFVNENQVLLLLSDGRRSFSAVGPNRLRPEVLDMPLDSWVLVEGIVLAAPSEPGPLLSGLTGSSERKLAAGFKLWLPEFVQIKVLRSPPFWNTQRLLAALGIILALLLASFVWSAAMRRRIAEQTEVIEAKIQSERVTEERERIARELHDSIEQELAALGIQIDLARLSNDESERQHTLAIAHRLLRRTQSETRRSIQDLRDRLLDRVTLSEALGLLVDRMQTECNATIQTNIEPLNFTVPGRVAQNLLRVGQEALNNAIRHGGDAISLSLVNQDGGSLELEIRDDGSGFNPAKQHPGHFGIAGMRERVRRIDARIWIDSQPGKGTCIRVVWPTPQNEKQA